MAAGLAPWGFGSLSSGIGRWEYWHCSPPFLQAIAQFTQQESVGRSGSNSVHNAGGILMESLMEGMYWLG